MHIFQLIFISADLALSLNLQLAAIDSNSMRKDAINCVIQSISEGVLKNIPEAVFRAIVLLLPNDATLLSTISEYGGDMDLLDSSEQLLVRITQLTDFQTRLKCMVGVLDIPKKLDLLEKIECQYTVTLSSLVEKDCPLFVFLKLVLDIGNSLNAGSTKLASGFKLGVLNQLRSMTAPRQPSLSLLHFITQSLAKSNPKTLEFVSDFVDSTTQCVEYSPAMFDDELRQCELQLRDIRSALVLSTNDIKQQYTSAVVTAGKRISLLKNTRKSLQIKICSFAEFYCENPANFDVCDYLKSLLALFSDVNECHQLYKLSILANEQKLSEKNRSSSQEKPAYGINSESTSTTYGSNYRQNSNDKVDGHTGVSIESHLAVSPTEVPIIKVNKRTSFDPTPREFPSFSTRDLSTSVNTPRESNTSIGSPLDFNSPRDLISPRDLNSPRDLSSSRDSISPREFSSSVSSSRGVSSPRDVRQTRSAELKSLHYNYKSIDGYSRGISHDSYDRSHSSGDTFTPSYFYSRSQKYNNDDKYRHSPPTREQDGNNIRSEETDSSESDIDISTFGGTDIKPRSSEQNYRTIGHVSSTGYIPKDSYLNQTFGGSCRTSHNRSKRADIRDIFSGSEPLRDRSRSADVRYASTSALASARSKRSHPAQSGLKSVLRTDRNSNKKEPPAIPKREPIPGALIKKDYTRSTPSLVSTGYQSRYSLSPPPPPPPPSSKSASPPINSPRSPSSLSPPTKYRPYSAGTKKTPLPSFIDEDSETPPQHHERQYSEPDTRRPTPGGMVKHSMSSTEVNRTGIETEV